MDRDYQGHEIIPGCFASNIESGWKGRVESIDTDPDGLRMAEMIGVDWLCTTFAGLTDEEALSRDDRQWHHVADLIVDRR